MQSRYEHLFSPMKIGKLEVKNRICLAPAGSGMSPNRSGVFDQSDEDYFVARAKGGTGLIFTGAVRTDTEVDSDKPGGLGNINISFNPNHFKVATSRIVDRVHSYGAKFIIQLTLGLGRNHGGKSPSPLPSYYNPSMICKELTTEEIQKKIKFLVDGAVTAKATGFDGVEVHALHFGYLLDELAMSYTNQRTDQYGGCFENRLRAAKEIIDGIKEKCGKDFPVTMRLGLKSYMKGFNQPSLHGDGEVGRTLEEGIEICKYLESIGYDALSVDAGTYDGMYYCYPPMYMPKGVNLKLAEEAKKAVNIPILVGGKMDDPDLCEKAIADGQADGVVIGRGLFADPDFAIKAKRNKPETIRPCLACNMGCRLKMKSGQGLTCAVNPTVRKESVYTITPAAVKKNVMVVGGGVAGLEAARTARIRGHEVTVYEKGVQLGGLLIPAGAPSFKEDDRKLVAWYENQLKELGVKVELNTQVDREMVIAKAPDVVISACGSVPVMPNISGVDHAKSMSCVDALLNVKPVGGTVVVAGGGLVGCELALDLTQKGKKVTIVEFADGILKAGKPLPEMNKSMLLDLLEDNKVEVKTSSKVVEVNDKGAVIETAEGREELAADSVIFAIGFKAVKSFAEMVEDLPLEVYSIGDERDVSNILNAIADGYEIGRNI